ncbi:hypothetical protein [Anabaena catenula]|uniref:Uncharacterized protein n=1 Tax=Anabaena catenula FACHB-362 TaxID=2692877 RepID=A0ABR8J4V0_9NOST|nr:hypothetical protein [Anabaena catenula]MBD2692640.1 hypothetical protein [Anabaena catenula FACHB-362]
MAVPTIAEVFGSGASQTATTITIAKADLPGLTASSSNTAESLLVGIILAAQAFLTQAAFGANIDQSTYIESGFPSFTNRGTNNDSYRVDQLTISLAKLDSGATLDPDDY